MKKIHELIVHTPAVIAADKILNVLNNSDKSPLLWAQPQQGKTNVAICLVDDFINHCKSHGKTYEIPYFINLSDNDVKKQTRIRLLEAGLYNQVKLMHQGNLKNYSPSNVDLRLIIDDEASYSSGKDRSVDLTFKKIGINISKPRHQWMDTRNLLASISATPWAHFYKPEHFEYINIEKNKEYLDFAYMQLKDRFRTANKIIENKKPTQYIFDRFGEFDLECAKRGPLWMVLRSRGDDTEIIKSLINDSYPKNPCYLFTEKNGNLDELDDYLKWKPTEPSFALIKNTLRAAKTLTTTKNIGLWIDSHTSKSDVLSQSVGRCAGQPENINGEFRDKHDDTFKIYCDTRHLDSIIKLYKDLENGEGIIKIPSGVQNKAGYSDLNKNITGPNKSNSKWYVCNLTDDVKARAAIIQNNAEMPYPLHPDTKVPYVDTRPMHVVSNNSSYNFSDAISGQRRGNSPGVIHFDKPPYKDGQDVTLKEHLKSFDKAKNQEYDIVFCGDDIAGPELKVKGEFLIGKVLVLVEYGEDIISIKKNMIKPSMLSSEINQNEQKNN